MKRYKIGEFRSSILRLDKNLIIQPKGRLLTTQEIRQHQLHVVRSRDVTKRAKGSLEGGA